MKPCFSEASLLVETLGFPVVLSIVTASYRGVLITSITVSPPAPFSPGEGGLSLAGLAFFAVEPATLPKTLAVMLSSTGS